MLEIILKSVSSLEIQNALFEILDKNVSQEVKDFDLEVNNSRDKYHLFKAFEYSASSNMPARNFDLLLRWAQYKWIRLALIYLSNQRAMLNSMADSRTKISDLSKMLKTSDANHSPHISIPAIPCSIEAAIQKDKINNLTIEQSFQHLEQIMIQVVSTAHPTDPLSDDARDLLTALSKQFAAQKPDADEIQQIIAALLRVDPIPYSQRTIIKEVERNIKLSLEPLYDQLPKFVLTICDAYKNYYSEDEFNKNEEKFWLALVSPKPIFKPASWPGFDADGNTNVTPQAMIDAIQSHRTRAIEIHHKALEQTVIATIKEQERHIREAIIRSKSSIIAQIYSGELPAEELQHLIMAVTEIFIDIDIYLNNREFVAITNKLKQLTDLINEGALNSDAKGNINKLVEEQNNNVKRLLEITQLSGISREGNNTHQGSLQKFIMLLDNYELTFLKKKSTKVDIENQTASDYIYQAFCDIMKEHKSIIDRYPDVKKDMRLYAIQLRCFGATLGVGHIRQNSPVLMKVWDTIISDLLSETIFSDCDILQPFKNKNYIKATDAMRTQFHVKLQDKNEESQKILLHIYRKFNADIYRHGEKYTSSPAIKDKYHQLLQELERFQLAVQNCDMIEKCIVSNTEGASNIFEAESLLLLFKPHFPQAINHHIRVVPLLEKRQDLKNYEAILTYYIKSKIFQRFFDLSKNNLSETSNLISRLFNGISIYELQNHLLSLTRDQFKALIPEFAQLIADIELEVMLGFSDTERVSGTTALIDIQETIENLHRLTKDYGVKLKIYYGPGGDPNRGGLAVRKEEATLQGNAISNLLNAIDSILNFLASLFNSSHQEKSNPNSFMEFTNLSDHLKEALKILKEAGAKFYEHLHDVEKGLGKLLSFMLGRGAHWLISILNSSSRSTQRGKEEDKGDRSASVQSFRDAPPPSMIYPENIRAIPAGQIKEFLRDYIDLIVGPGYGLRKIGVTKAAELYDNSKTVRDMITKLAFGVFNADYRITAYALFGDNSRFVPTSEAERFQWATECGSKEFQTDLENCDLESLVNSEIQLTRKKHYFIYHDYLLILSKNIMKHLNSLWNSTVTFMSHLT